MKQNRLISFLVILVTYVVALVLAIFVFKKDLSQNFYLNIFIADVIATIFVYLVGVIFNNASVYDPYWSVAPLVIIPLSIIYFGNIHIGIILLLVAISYWGIRLTLNWAYTFRNLNHQDWRYTMIKEKTGKVYPLVSFLGINLFPTIIVYLVSLPALYYIKNSQFNPLSIIGFVVCITAATIQLIADIKVHRFRKENKKDEVIRNGLWKYSRHPNYFGEILMWFGVFIFCFVSDVTIWNLIIGPIANMLMFLVISIPMQENRLLSYKSDYQDYIRSTNKLIPWFSKE